MNTNTNRRSLHTLSGTQDGLGRLQRVPMSEDWRIGCVHCIVRTIQKHPVDIVEPLSVVVREVAHIAHQLDTNEKDSPHVSNTDLKSMMRFQPLHERLLLGADLNSKCFALSAWVAAEEVRISNVHQFLRNGSIDQESRLRLPRMERAKCRFLSWHGLIAFLVVQTLQDSGPGFPFLLEPLRQAAELFRLMSLRIGFLNSDRTKITGLHGRLLQEFIRLINWLSVMDVTAEFQSYVGSLSRSFGTNPLEQRFSSLRGIEIKDSDLTRETRRFGEWIRILSPIAPDAANIKKAPNHLLLRDSTFREMMKTKNRSEKRIEAVKIGHDTYRLRLRDLPEDVRNENVRDERLQKWDAVLPRMKTRKKSANQK